MSPDEVPDFETFEENSDDSDKYSKYKFAAGHIYTWWKYFMKLPSEVRPVFTPTAGFSDTFMQFSEDALLPILYGDTRILKDAHPTRSIIEKISSRVNAAELVKTQYGEFLRRLFVGDRAAIRQDPKKRQTSYGRQTTTMVQLAMQAPEAYGRQALDAHWGLLSEFYESRKNAAASGSPFTGIAPALPKGKVQGRYALSNYLVTDGLQAHIRGFDITKPHLSPKARANICDIKRRFPDRDSVVKTFGGKYKDCAVIGVDPGEVIAASFCGLDPRKPTQVTNLHIKRAALYSPTLAHRRAMEQLKRQRPTIDAPSDIHPSVWTKKQPTPSSARQPCAVVIPSIQELEASLPSSRFESLSTYHAGMKQFHYVFEALSGFYGAKSIKKKSWEKRKSTRAEMDWAVNGALQIVSRLSSADRKALIVYGDGRFNTRTKLTSLHESFKGYFFMKVNHDGVMHFAQLCREHAFSSSFNSF